jgi:NADP-dependent 3-hydroxy acid dehydrogenase YdfG
MSRPVALITGASRGIGRAIALEFGRTHTIIGGARSAEALSGLLKDLPDAVPWPVDLSDLPSLAKAAEAIDRVDVLVHSAGIAIEKPLAELNPVQWQASFAVNVFAVAELTRLLLPKLRASHGTVVLLNSGSGLFSYRNGAAYSGTKFALRTLGDCLREEERENGVRVVSIHPGFVDTDMGRGIRKEQGDAYDPRYYVTPETIAAGVRVAVDAPPEAQFEMMSIRPSLLQVNIQPLPPGM